MQVQLQNQNAEKKHNMRSEYMGWCSATEIFDTMADILLGSQPVDPKEVLLRIAQVLEDNDWDCQHDSDYWNHPHVREIFKKLHPDTWDWDEVDKYQPTYEVTADGKKKE